MSVKTKKKNKRIRKKPDKCCCDEAEFTPRNTENELTDDILYVQFENRVKTEQSANYCK